MRDIPLPHINLQKGWPSRRLIPREHVQAAAEATLTDPDRGIDALLYGPNKGDPALRERCAEWLSGLYGLSVVPERICITAGASANLASIMQAFSDPVYTRRVWMAEPTYFLACTIFEDAGFQGRMEGVPEDDEGLDVEWLRSHIESVDAETKANTETEASPQAYKTIPTYRKLYRHIIYCVPTFSNPRGRSYTIKRREELVRLARQVDALLITDDCYDFLLWDVQDPGPSSEIREPQSRSINEQRKLHPPPRLTDIDRILPGGDEVWGNAVSNASFSKVIGPGMRCGWAEATPQFIIRLNQTGSILSGGAPAQFASTVIEHVLRTGRLEDHLVNTLIPTYRTRAARLRRAVQQTLGPMGVTIDSDNGTDGIIGGFFLYITLPVEFNVDNLAELALDKYNLRVLAGARMAVKGSKHLSSIVSQGIRLSWSWEEEEQIVQGIARLAKAMNDPELVKN
ncbi:hypothetical protein A1O3_00186 [Capronia epimyces CBS 606.96]|uniref:Aminotransferase class I/classII large domain-containing protein n=1 Tax=Capronia epimyces CBS 606.96 TaxID=1182542 RepID=W9YQU5_9EURO|nr:uncharacterized protein A1O3_00186 [Capronia epimyces CBS 606.96]EXJ91636.1 hypothetical protein A1O3_00186 [Capronia epimyces CBS 606.96]